MNIFVLNTGRCGSSTFIKACQHISNYSAGHETRSRLIGDQRLAYPQSHIEADNRLSWFLGRLDQSYGDNALYVHLTRDKSATTESFVRRAHFGIMQAYTEGVLMGGAGEQTAEALAADYIDTIEANIRLFLKDKSNTMHFRLEQAKVDFPLFWERIAAEGDLQQAMSEWDYKYNASAERR
jgi:hypothetical protein